MIRGEREIEFLSENIINQRKGTFDATLLHLLSKQTTISLIPFDSLYNNAPSKSLCKVDNSPHAMTPCHCMHVNMPLKLCYTYCINDLLYYLFVNNLLKPSLINVHCRLSITHCTINTGHHQQYIPSQYCYIHIDAIYSIYILYNYIHCFRNITFLFCSW